MPYRIIVIILHELKRDKRGYFYFFVKMKFFKFLNWTKLLNNVVNICVRTNLSHCIYHLKQIFIISLRFKIS